jgi:hypothetical protein
MALTGQSLCTTVPYLFNELGRTSGQFLLTDTNSKILGGWNTLRRSSLPNSNEHRDGYFFTWHFSLCIVTSAVAHKAFYPSQNMWTFLRKDIKGNCKVCRKELK